MVPFAQHLVEAHGWRMAYRALGGILLGLLALTLRLPWKTFAASRADNAGPARNRPSVAATSLCCRLCG